MPVHALVRPYPRSVNPRRMVVEDRALALAEALDADGRTYAAARLRGAVPETFGLCDEHVPLLRDALTAIAEGAPPHADHARRVLAVLDDLPSHIGRRGRVWVRADGDGTYSAFWDDADWLEQGPTDVLLADALAWAAKRSDDVRRNDG